MLLTLLTGEMCVTAAGEWVVGFDASIDFYTSNPRNRTFVLFEGDELAGMSSFLGIDETRQVLEIGGTYYRPHLRGTGFNRRVKDMMLKRAFDCGIRRIEFRIDRDIHWHYKESLPYHPNALTLHAYDAKDGVLHEGTFYSVGGGFVVTDAEAKSRATRMACIVASVPEQARRTISTAGAISTRCFTWMVETTAERAR